MLIRSLFAGNNRLKIRWIKGAFQQMLKPVQLGANSGLQVSRLCLGTMNFGEPGKGHQGDWTLDLAASREIFKGAIERGFFYFDCADAY